MVASIPIEVVIQKNTRNLIAVLHNFLISETINGNNAINDYEIHVNSDCENNNDNKDKKNNMQRVEEMIRR
jgi:hypothetical protein